MKDDAQYTDWTPELEQDPDRKWLERFLDLVTGIPRRDRDRLRAIADRLRPWPEGAPDPRFVPPAGTEVRWEGATYVVETGVPRQGTAEAWYIDATLDRVGFRLPLDEIERIPSTRRIVVEVPADVPDHQIIVARQTTARVQGEYRTEPIPGARIIGEEDDG